MDYCGGYAALDPAGYFDHGGFCELRWIRAGDFGGWRLHFEKVSGVWRLYLMPVGPGCQNGVDVGAATDYTDLGPVTGTTVIDFLCNETVATWNAGFGPHSLQLLL